MQIQTLEYVLNDMIHTKINEFILILYSFTPSYITFLKILMPKVIFVKFLSQKSCSVELFLSYICFRYNVIFLKMFDSL